MSLITCPDCKREVSDMAPSCPGCGRPMSTKVTTEAVPPKPRKPPPNPQVESMLRMVVLFIGIIGGAFVGVLVAQYAPLFGDSFRMLGEPWSPARWQLIPVHSLVFGTLGAVGAYFWARQRAKSFE